MPRCGPCVSSSPASNAASRRASEARDDLAILSVIAVSVIVRVAAAWRAIPAARLSRREGPRVPDRRSRRGMARTNQLHRISRHGRADAGVTVFGTVFRAALAVAAGDRPDLDAWPPAM